MENTTTITMTPEMQALMAEMEALRAQNAKLKAANKGKAPKPSLKVSEKGALSVYGMGRWPVTLYREQWVKLLDMDAEIRAFISANNDTLKFKAEVEPAV